MMFTPSLVIVPFTARLCSFAVDSVHSGPEPPRLTGVLASLAFSQIWISVLRSTLWLTLPCTCFESQLEQVASGPRLTSPATKLSPENEALALSPMHTLPWYCPAGPVLVNLPPKFRTVQPVNGPNAGLAKGQTFWAGWQTSLQVAVGDPSSHVSPSAAWITPSPQTVQSLRQFCPLPPAAEPGGSQVSPCEACTTLSPQDVQSERQPLPTDPAVPSHVSPCEACITPSPQEVQSERQPEPTDPAVPSHVSPSPACSTPSPQEVQSARQPVPTEPAVPSQVSLCPACSTPSPQEAHPLAPVVRQPVPTAPAVPSQVSPCPACSTPSPQEVQSVRQP